MRHEVHSTPPARDRKRTAAHRGFTLVEALATLVLFAIVLPVALQAISLALGMGSNTARRTEATLLAESKLAELLATEEWQDGDLEGDFSKTPSGDALETETAGEMPVYRWSATSEDWLDISVKELTVRVVWTARGIDREVLLTTLVYTPET